MKRLGALMLTATLAACGVDGDPLPPAPRTSGTGVTVDIDANSRSGVRISGEARVGVISSR